MTQKLIIYKTIINITWYGEEKHICHALWSEKYLCFNGYFALLFNFSLSFRAHTEWHVECQYVCYFFMLVPREFEHKMHYNLLNSHFCNGFPLQLSVWINKYLFFHTFICCNSQNVSNVSIVNMLENVYLHQLNC